ncbi:MAG: acyl-CoA dehydrogenase family protein [Mycobacteriales bacterium]
MFLDYTPAQQELRAELRAYFAGLLTDEVRARLGEPGSGGPAHREVIRRLGADGWLGIGWPVEFGGQGRPATDQFIFFDEAQRAGAPLPLITLNTVGPTIMKFGSPSQQAELLPRILAGELTVAIGYTEAEAGTDLAALRTRAVRDGDSWVVNGAKLFTSGAHDADLIWLAVRTDPAAPKHRGISILLVPTSAEGFTVTPILTVGGIRTNATYYSDVRVPLDALVGQENGGWKMMTNQLNHERVALAALAGPAYRLWAEVRGWALGEPGPDGGPIADQPWVQISLARSFARLQATKLVNWRLVADTAAGQLAPAAASAAKVFGTETLIEIYRDLQNVLGVGGYLTAGSAGAALRGELERAVRAAQINTFGGGVNEVQREIVATVGLGMPRAAR